MPGTLRTLMREYCDRASQLPASRMPWEPIVPRKPSVQSKVKGWHEPLNGAEDELECSYELIELEHAAPMLEVFVGVLDSFVGIEPCFVVDKSGMLVTLKSPGSNSVSAMLQEAAATLDLAYQDTLHGYADFKRSPELDPDELRQSALDARDMLSVGYDDEP